MNGKWQGRSATWRLMIAAIGAGMLCSSTAAQSGSIGPIKDDGAIYLLTPGQTSARWVSHDAPGMQAALAEMAPNMKLEVLDGGGDVSKQQAQMEAAIAAGAKGIILVAVDGTNATGLLQAAKNADVPVVGYAHDLTGQDMSGLVAAQITTLLSADYHVPHCVELGKKIEASSQWSATSPFKLALFNIESGSGIGRIIYEACQAGLKPSVDAGKLKIVCMQDLPDFTAATAQKATEQCLTAQGNDVNGFSVGNDDQADGIYAALAAQKLQDKVLIYGGYDATLTGVQRVAGGYQDFDVYPPFKTMAHVAVQTLLSQIDTAVPMPAEVDTRYLNAAKVDKGGVPAAFLRNTKLTKDNLDATVVADGLFTKQQICTGVATGSSYCKN